MRLFLTVIAIAAFPTFAWSADCEVPDAYQGTWQVMIEGSLARQIALAESALSGKAATGELSDAERAIFERMREQARDDEGKKRLRERVDGLRNMTVTIETTQITTHIGDQEQTDGCLILHKDSKGVVLTLSGDEPARQIRLQRDGDSLVITDTKERLRLSKRANVSQ